MNFRRLFPHSHVSFYGPYVALILKRVNLFSHKPPRVTVRINTSSQKSFSSYFLKNRSPKKPKP